MDLCDELTYHILSYFVTGYDKKNIYLTNDMMFSSHTCRQWNHSKKRHSETYVLSRSGKRHLRKYNCKYQNAITYAFSFGYRNQLDWFKQYGYRVSADKPCTSWVCSRGWVHILDWLHHSGAPFDYDERAINNACENGHVKVLDWFVQNGYLLKYDERAINHACKHGHIAVLDWFYTSRYPFKWTNSTVAIEVGKGNTAVFEWFCSHGYDFGKDNEGLMIWNACENGKTNILEWVWSLNPILFSSHALHPIRKCTYIQYYMRHACRNGHISVLDWFHKKNILTYDAYGLCAAYHSGHIHILEWLKTNDYSLDYPPNEILKSETELFMWFRCNKYPRLSKTSLNEWLKANI